MPMIIGPRTGRRLMFLRYPKIGGMWMIEALTNAEVTWVKRGYNYWDYKRSRGLATRAVRFTIARDPRRWYASYFIQRTIAGWGGDLSIGHKCRATNFEHFIHRVVGKRPGYLTELFRRYRGPSSTRVLMNETLVDSLVDLLNEFSIPFDEERLRSTPRVNVLATAPKYSGQCQYTRTLERMIYETERPLFDAYGYQLWRWKDETTRDPRARVC